VAGRIVLFGATGYTGRMTAEALVRRGARPVLAGRSTNRLEDMSAELDGLDFATAEVADPATVMDLVDRGDVLVTTVGPFARWGQAAAEAAIKRGAHYLDSTGEPQFIREVFERYGPAAARAGIGMLTAFGYDWVPGNLAGALALHRAGGEAVRVDVGYFFTGDYRNGASGGTLASLAGVVAAPGYAWRDGRIVTERVARRVRGFDVDGRHPTAFSVGSSEHFALPRLDPRLREVNTFLGWFGPLSRPMQVVSMAGSIALKVPGASAAFDALANRFVKGSTGGPDADTRAKSGSHIVAEAYGPGDRLLARVAVTGGNGYDFTAGVLAWGSMKAAEGALRGTGALGPVDGYGLEVLEAGCAEAGLRATPA
jgi:short subunit dehydrogenase-like uncharacterized protein